MRYACPSGCAVLPTATRAERRQHVRVDFPGSKQSWHREESQDLAHDAIALIGLEKKLSVRGTIQNDQFLRLRSFFVLRTNARKPWAPVVAVIAGDDEQSSGLQLCCGEVRRRTQKYDAINLTWHGFDGRIAGSSAAEAAPNHRHRLDAMSFQVANRGEHIVLKRRVIEIRLARTA